MSKIIRGLKLAQGWGTGGTNPLVLTTQPKRHEEDKWKCPKCGRYNSFKNQRCAYCGASVLSDKK